MIPGFIELETREDKAVAINGFDISMVLEHTKETCEIYLKGNGEPVIVRCAYPALLELIEDAIEDQEEEEYELHEKAPVEKKGKGGGK